MALHINYELEFIYVFCFYAGFIEGSQYCLLGLCILQVANWVFGNAEFQIKILS